MARAEKRFDSSSCMDESRQMAAHVSKTLAPSKALILRDAGFACSQDKDSRSRSQLLRMRPRLLKQKSNKDYVSQTLILRKSASSPSGKISSPEAAISSALHHLCARMPARSNWVNPLVSGEKSSTRIAKYCSTAKNQLGP